MTRDGDIDGWGGDRRPILVTGSHRSGSSWVGKMIATSPRIGYIHEPFNVDHHPGVCPMVVPFWFLYLTEDNAREFAPHLDRTLRFSYSPLAELIAVRRPRHLGRLLFDGADFAKYRFQRRRPLIKDPLALFSAEWLASNYDMKVVLLVRHPAAFASSVRRQEYRHPFSHFLQQPRLMHDHLESFESDIQAMHDHTPDSIEESALLWRITTHMTLKLKDSHPDWLFYRYEDLASDPAESFERIFNMLHLEFNSEIRDRIVRSTHPNISGWRRHLSRREIDVLRSEVDELAGLLYTDADW